jgi:branched-chain amino acid transport system substrate-binding protein
MIKRALRQFMIASAVVAASFIAASNHSVMAAEQAPGVTDGEIVVGAFGPLTGPSAWIGLSARDGLILAANEINANGGVNGRKIKLLFEGAATPADSIAAAKKLVEQDKVFTLVIGAGSTGAAAAADYLREVGIPTYNIVGATPKIREPYARNIFHGVFPDARLLSDYFAREVINTVPAPKTAAVLVGTYEFPQAVFAGLVPRLEKLGVAVKTVQKFDAGAKDFTAQLLAIARDKPDVIVFLGSAAEVGLAVKQGPEIGLAGVPWVIDVAGISRSVPKVAGDASEGIRSIWMFPYFHDQSEKPMADFDRKWRAAYGTPAAGRPSYIDINGYGDMYVLALALRAAGRDLSWSGLIQTWEKLKAVKPSDFGPFASDVIFPESFSETDRDGNKAYSTVRVTNGVWHVQK